MSASVIFGLIRLIILSYNRWKKHMKRCKIIGHPRIMLKLYRAYAFNWIVLRVKFGLTMASYEELPLALCVSPCLLSVHVFIVCTSVVLVIPLTLVLGHTKWIMFHGSSRALFQISNKNVNHVIIFMWCRYSWRGWQFIIWVAKCLGAAVVKKRSITVWH